jgi:protein-S-isoprenylcysteine O-methyltransferase Ste14
MALFLLMIVADWLVPVKHLFGMLLFLIGLTLVMESAAVWLRPVLFFLFANFWYIPHEKKAAEHFGDPYLEYRKKVRRWL